MSITTQEASFILFNAAEVDWKWINPFTDYVNYLTTSYKKSAAYYFDEGLGQFPGWKLVRCPEKLLTYQKTIQKALRRRIGIQIDRRRTYLLAVDDTALRRYGRTAYATYWYYSNAHGGIIWGNKLVNTVLTSGNLAVPVAHDLHQRDSGKKLWELGRDQLLANVSWLRQLTVSKKQIWATGDTIYGNKAIMTTLRDLDISHLLGIAKNRTVELFGRRGSVRDFFATQTQRSLTVAGHTYTYKISTANLKDVGRCRLLAVKEAGKGWKYYASNRLKATARTLLKRKRDHWAVEVNHHNIKKFHGAEEVTVWKKERVVGHFELVYLAAAVTALEQAERLQRGEVCTAERLNREARRWSRQHWEPDRRSIS